MKKFPETDDVLLHKDVAIEGMSQEEIANCAPIAIHPAALGYGTQASVKPGCGMDVFSKLKDHILHDGFVSSTEPLLISPTVIEHREAEKILLFQGHNLPAFSIRYTKGPITNIKSSKRSIIFLLDEYIV